MVTRERFVAKVRELANESPDHVYVYSGSDPSGDPTEGSSCRYLNAGEDPDDKFAYGCLFGQVMRQLGEPIPSHMEGKDIGYAVRHMLGWSENDLLVRAACAAQSDQDSGRPWGDALETFDRELAGD